MAVLATRMVVMLAALALKDLAYGFWIAVLSDLKEGYLD